MSALYTLSLHDALPIFFLAISAGQALAEDNSSLKVAWDKVERVLNTTATLQVVVNPPLRRGSPIHDRVDRKSTRLNSSHITISYAVFCLKKKKFYKTAL